ncbi:MAG: C-GCAxxG-C-C family protein [Eggerthellaceae bacterium]|jgi:C_GCAxxG_C_C family probable redox protein
MDEDIRKDCVERALAMHARGYNCAQCVACALADYTDADADTLFRLMEGFGGGMGGFTETCGAISGGIAVLGNRLSGGMDHPHTKGDTYQFARELVSRFREQNGSTLCPELKGLTGGPVLRSCDGCIVDAVDLTLDLLEVDPEGLKLRSKAKR